MTSSLLLKFWLASSVGEGNGCEGSGQKATFRNGCEFSKHANFSQPMGFKVSDTLVIPIVTSGTRESGGYVSISGWITSKPEVIRTNLHAVPPGEWRYRKMATEHGNARLTWNIAGSYHRRRSFDSNKLNAALHAL